MQEMEARFNIHSHGQSTNDFFPDVIRGWLVLLRSGLSESSKKTVLGSTENTLGRFEDRGSLSIISGQIISFWFLMEIATETVVERCVRTSSRSNRRVGAGDALECNSNRKCRSEDEEEAFNLARTQLHEAFASERNARRTVAASESNHA